MSCSFSVMIATSAVLILFISLKFKLYILVVLGL